MVRRNKVILLVIARLGLLKQFFDSRHLAGAIKDTRHGEQLIEQSCRVEVGRLNQKYCFDLSKEEEQLVI